MTVTITSSRGDDGPLSAEDALRQLLDLFDLLNLAADDSGLVWNLVSVSRNSPLTATGEAICYQPGVDVTSSARLAKAHLAEALSAVVEGNPAPDWLNESGRNKMRSMFGRNLDSISRTYVQFYEAAPSVAIVEKNARLGIQSLDRQVFELRASEPDFSRVERGSVEGEVDNLDTYYRQPAIRITERRSKHSVPCVMSTDLAARVGGERAWNDVWKGLRVRVVGKITYKRDGNIALVSADDLIVLTKRVGDHDDLPYFFLKGRSPQSYIDANWADDIG